MRGDEPSPTRSAVLVRLSHGHIRIGTFQRLARSRSASTWRALVDYCLAQFPGPPPPEDAPGRDEPAVMLMHQVVERLADLAASLHGRRLRPRRAQHRQHEHHRRELRLRPVALAAALGPGLHRRLFRPRRALCLRPPARGDPLELRRSWRSRCGCWPRRSRWSPRSSGSGRSTSRRWRGASCWRLGVRVARAGGRHGADRGGRAAHARERGTGPTRSSSATAAAAARRRRVRRAARRVQAGRASRSSATGGRGARRRC